MLESSPLETSTFLNPRVSGIYGSQSFSLHALILINACWRAGTLPPRVSEVLLDKRINNAVAEFGKVFSLAAERPVGSRHLANYYMRRDTVERFKRIVAVDYFVPPTVSEVLTIV